MTVRRRPFGPIVVATACLLLAGCAGAGAPSTAPADDVDGAGSPPIATEADLVGMTWVVEALTTATDEVPTTSSIAGLPTLVFADGTLTGTDGCNRLGAEYTVVADRLDVGDLARTRMGCPDSDDQAGHLDGGGLVLSNLDLSLHYHPADD